MEYSTKPDVWFKSLMDGKFRKGHTPANKGKKWGEYMSEESASRIRAAAAVARVGKPNPNAGRKGHPIIAIKGGKRQRFGSISDTAAKLGLDRRDIINVLKGRQKTTHGYTLALAPVKKKVEQIFKTLKL